MSECKEKIIEHYQKAVNEVDDYFEYRHVSDLDKYHVRKILADLTEKLESACTKADTGV